MYSDVEIGMIRNKPTKRMKLALWIVHRRGWQHLLFGLAMIIAIGRTGINKSITISRNAVE